MKTPKIYLPVEEVVDTKFYKNQRRKSHSSKCVHKFWVCKCSICGKVLGSESNLDFLKDNK